MSSSWSWAESTAFNRHARWMFGDMQLHYTSTLVPFPPSTARGTWKPGKGSWYMSRSPNGVYRPIILASNRKTTSTLHQFLPCSQGYSIFAYKRHAQLLFGGSVGIRCSHSKSNLLWMKTSSIVRTQQSHICNGNPISQSIFSTAQPFRFHVWIALVNVPAGLPAISAGTIIFSSAIPVTVFLIMNIVSAIIALDYFLFFIFSANI